MTTLTATFIAGASPRSMKEREVLLAVAGKARQLIAPEQKADIDPEDAAPARSPNGPPGKQLAAKGTRIARVASQ
jgi:hypothetical protein